MEYHNVPGVSIAVINDHQIDWAKGRMIVRLCPPTKVLFDSLAQTEYT